VERLLGEYPGLVVLGDPGAGKSTLLKVLALACADGRAQERLGLEGEWLPILLPMAAYAAALHKSEECSLLAFLPDYFCMRGLDCDLAPLLADTLKRGQAMILLDGLDEVLEGRPFVAARVEDFFREYAPAGNRLVVTSRIVGYRDVPLRAEGLTTITLVDFQREQIEQFAHNWCHAFEVATHGDTPEAHRAAEAEKDELLQAIFSNPGVERLASNPLLLTILALIKRQGVTLPHRRVELYELYLRTLISAWSQARALDQRPVGPALDYLETAQVLAPLALWLREAYPGAGLATRAELENWLTRYYQDEWELPPGEARQKARGFMAAVHRYSNLLVERGEGTYGFIHLTFEEYLAAQGIAQRGQLNVGNTVKVLSDLLTDPAWHETTLLTVGYLGIVQRNRHTAAAVVEGLVEADVPAAERGWNVVVAGEALRDVGPAGVTEDCRRRVIDRLISVMQDVAVAPVYRRQAGLLLGWLGWRPDDLDDWVEIPAGPFLYGDGREKHVIERPYRIGKYPVTNAQFARFVEAGGYKEEKWWSEEGLAWRSGESDDRIKEDFWRDWVKKRTPEQRNRPMWWGDPELGNPLAPVVGVSWYEAEAYGRWLTEELRQAGILGGDGVARLPTEEEWERAARGSDGREYPWGEGFDVARANLSIGERPAGGSTAVMTYPDGFSPDRVWDCSGNVWEWTHSWWSEEKTYRVLRGGSWGNFDGRLARCSSRGTAPPAGFDGFGGFRVVVSAALSPGSELL
jgi:formylglycine-generating enzyme required for sulfatase activity